MRITCIFFKDDNISKRPAPWGDLLADIFPSFLPKSAGLTGT